MEIDIISDRCGKSSSLAATKMMMRMRYSTGSNCTDEETATEGGSSSPLMIMATPAGCRTDI
jgi:hypothetical protein